MSDWAPVALFVYNDVERAAASLQALRQCKGAESSRLNVFCDGPATSAEIEDVERVRRHIQTVEGFAEVDIVEHAEHLGRSRMIFDGVTQVVNADGRAIIVEDDLRVSPYFLQFMNDGLDVYADNDSVISVCGFSYHADVSIAETCFLPGAHCWGWATWQRGWSEMRLDPEKLVEEIVSNDLVHAFDGGGAEPLTQMLQACSVDDDRCWALCWMASAIAAHKLTLHPGRSLVAHVDYSASTSRVASVFKSPLSDDEIRVQSTLVKVDDGLLHAVRASMMRWRARKSAGLRLFSMASALLPQSLERTIYSSMIRMKLEQAARQEPQTE